jgi:glycosyltransferase involved in cell wall biosynthesis
MRICRVQNSFPNRSNPGGGLYSYYLAKYIDEPTLYLIKATRSEKSEIPPHVRLREIKSWLDGAWSVRSSNHRVEIVHSYVPERQLKKILQSGEYFLRSLPPLIRFRPEIVVCKSTLKLLHGLFAKYALGAKFVASLHNTSEIDLMKRIPFLRWMLGRADLIFVVAREIEEGVKRMMPKAKVVCTPTGVDLEMFQHRALPRKKQLIAVGSFKSKKGFSYLIDAMAEFFPRHPDYQLLIAGDGERRKEIEEQIKSNNLEGKIILLGIVQREQLVQLLNESKLFVMSSLYEGFPKALLEALACGTPAVITTGCNATEIIKETGLMVSKGDSRALAEAACRLIEDDRLWTRCAGNCRAVAMSYEWKEIASTVYRNLQGILENRAHV